MSGNKYSKSKIHTIRYYDEPEYLYIGATVQKLETRFKSHMNAARTEPGNNSKFYQAIRKSENKHWWYIELYENYPCKNKEQLDYREQQIIKMLKPTLNTYNLQSRRYFNFCFLFLTS